MARPTRTTRHLNWRYLKSLLKQQGLSQIDLAHYIPLRPEQVSRLLRGLVRDPLGSTVERIAEFVGVIPSDLYTVDNASEALVLGENRSTYQTGRVIAVSKIANATESFPPPAPATSTPEGHGPYGAVTRPIADRAAFGVLILGDSMEPAYPAGTRVVASPACGVRDGRVHYIRDNTGKSYVRKIQTNGESYLLLPLNPTHLARRVSFNETAEIALVIAADLPE